MLIFFILFLELLTLLIGVNILSDDGIGIKNFLLWLLLIQIIGQFFYMEIGFLAIFLVLFFLITCLIIKSKKIFSSILITCLP